MIILAIKLNNGTQLFAEAQDDTEMHLIVRDVIGTKDVQMQHKDGSVYVQAIPYLYFPFNTTQTFKIPKSSILFYDVCDDYTTFYYSNIYNDLVGSENTKRKYIMALHEISMEDSPYSLKEEQDEYDEPTRNDYYTPEELMNVVSDTVDESDYDERYYYKSDNEKITIH